MAVKGLGLEARNPTFCIYSINCLNFVFLESYLLGDFNGANLATRECQKCREWIGRRDPKFENSIAHCGPS